MQCDVDSETGNSDIGVLSEISSWGNICQAKPVMFMWLDKSPLVAQASQQNISMKICGMSPTANVVNISCPTVLQIFI